MRSDITKIKWFLSPALVQSELKTETILDKTERFWVQNIHRGRVITESYQCYQVTRDWHWLRLMTEEVNLVLTVAHSEDWAFIETQLVLEPVSYSGIFSQTSDPHVTSCLSSGGGGGGLWWNMGSPSSQIICHHGFIMLTHWLAVWSSNSSQLPPYLHTLLNPWSFTIW